MNKSRSWFILEFSIVILSGCHQFSDEFQSEPEQQTSGTQIIEADAIDRTEILDEALQYYQNIAQLANWYADSPTARLKSNLIQIETPQGNTVLTKLDELKLVDSTGQAIGFFDLSPEEREQFLTDWIDIEAHELSQKLKFDPEKRTSELIIRRNTAFTKVMGTLKSADLSTNDPYWLVKQEMDEMQTMAWSKSTLSHERSDTLTDDNFWGAVVANGMLSYSMFQFSPIEISPQTFVDRIRKSVRRGRILVALPGGWSTWPPVVFYPNKTYYDVGHAAILSKDYWELEEEVSDTFNFSIGMSFQIGMNHEKIGHSWCVKHGLAHVGQVYDSKWQRYKKSKLVWKWRKIVTDADNLAIYNEAPATLGSQYCNVVEVLFAKWAAPKTFICSSSVWWYAREGTGIHLNDWWNTTILPVDLYLSDHVRIIDNTLN